jgi:hypothetical protein
MAMAANILAYIWKWLPFWTLIFLSARMVTPKEIYEAAAIDGATSIQQTVHVTFPLMANVYLVATLLSTLWTFGDFPTVHFVSSGAPAHHGGAGNLRLSRSVRLWPSGARGGSDDVGFAARHPNRYPLDAAPAQDQRATMTGRPANEPATSRVVAGARNARHRHRRRPAGGIAGAALGVVLLIWTLLPVYNMVLIALDVSLKIGNFALGNRLSVGGIGPLPFSGVPM